MGRESDDDRLRGSDLSVASGAPENLDRVAIWYSRESDVDECLTRKLYT